MRKEANETAYDAASSVLQRVADMATYCISRRPQNCGGSSHDDDCRPVQSGWTPSEQGRPISASAWRNQYGRHAHPQRWMAVPAISADICMAEWSYPWQGAGSNEGKWPGYHAHLECDAMDGSSATVEYTAEANNTLSSVCVSSFRHSSHSDEAVVGMGPGQARFAASESAGFIDLSHGRGDGRNGDGRRVDAAESTQMGAERLHTMCLLEAEQRWTGQQLAVAVAAGAATGQAGPSGSERQIGWRQTDSDALQAAVLESQRQQSPQSHRQQDACFRWGKPAGRFEDHYNGVVSIVDGDRDSSSGGVQAQHAWWQEESFGASEWRCSGTDWVRAEYTSGGCCDGQGHVVHGSSSRSESQYSRAGRLDSHCGHGGGGLALSAGGEQSRSHETWDRGPYTEGGAAAVYPRMIWEGEGRMGAADNLGWHWRSNSQERGGSLSGVTGISDAATTPSGPSRPFPYAGIQVCSSGYGSTYGSDGGRMPALADGQALEGGAAVAWPGVGSA